jgi:hypothetical protein
MFREIYYRLIVDRRGRKTLPAFVDSSSAVLELGGDIL